MRANGAPRGPSAPDPSDRQTVSTRGVRVHLAAAALAAALLGGAALPAGAHQLDHPTLLRMAVRPDAVVVSVTYDVDPGDPSRQLRGLFDRDSDGQLDVGEQAKLLRYLEDTARLWLEVDLGGRPLALVVRSREGSRLGLPAEATSSLGISLVLTASVALADPARLRIADRDKDASRHVPLVVDVAPELHPRFASRGEWHPELRQLHRVMLGPDRALELTLVPTPPT